MKENEIKYKNCIKEFEESLKKYEDKYMRLKMHATEQMNKYNNELTNCYNLFIISPLYFQSHRRNK